MKFKLAQIAALAILDFVLIASGLGVFAPALISMRDTPAALTGALVVIIVICAVVLTTLKIVSIIKSMEPKENA